jgi:hypothetical protein
MIKTKDAANNNRLTADQELEPALLQTYGSEQINWSTQRIKPSDAMMRLSHLQFGAGRSYQQND